MSTPTKPASSRIAQRRLAAQLDGGADYAAKRAELIRIAADVFREKGYAPATLNDVAARFGTDRASLYYYVGSKEELFQECIKGTLETNIERAEIITASDISPRQKLTELIGYVIQAHVDNYPYMYVYIQEDMSHVANEDAQWATDMAEKTHRFEGYFRAAIDEGVADGSFRTGMSTTLVTNSLFGMMMWTHRWFVPGKKYTAEDLVDTFTKIFFEGIDSE